MKIATVGMQYAVAGLFLLLSAVTYRQWRRLRERTWLLLSFSVAMLGSIAVIGRISAITDYRLGILGDISVLTFLASGYGLLLVRNEMLPLSHLVLQLSRIALVAAAIAGIGLKLPTRPDMPVQGLDFVGLSIVIGAWMACCVEPIFRFWIAARGRPPVQRSRLRALSVAYGSIIALLILLLSAARQVPGPGMELTYQIVSLGLVMPLFAAFSPPTWLRRFWRESEEDALRLSMRDLLRFAENAAGLAERGLEWAIRLVGADAGAVVDCDGGVLATRGDLSPDDHLLTGRTSAGLEQDAIIVPLHLTGGAGSLMVVSGPFTPLFGADEVSRLREYASSLAVAIERARLVEALAAERSSYESLLQSVSDLGEGFLVIESMKVVYANDAYSRLSGYSLEELRALPSIVDLATPSAREAIADRIRRRANGEVIPDHYESEMFRKDGRRIDVEVAQKFTTTSDGIRTISIIRDITERKRADQELQRLDLDRRTFIVNAAHELRTPLAVVTGMASMLSSRRDALTKSQQEEGFNALSRQVERVRILIDNLLDLTVIEHEAAAGSIALQAVPIAEAAKRALESAPPPNGKSVEIQLSEAFEVLADPMRLDQVLVNMYTNAYRYGGEHIRLEGIETEGFLVLTVADDGPGVPPDLIPSLFDPFTRGPDSRYMHGSGLGLVIVRRLVEMFGGEVWYEPNQPCGAKFSLRLQEVA